MITSGTRLGPYEIVSRIGAGGMGEVWRATDTRLDRSVAIKVLPAEFAQSAQAKSRFEREAKAISQLNHPNICSLFDVGDGFLAMELLDGVTLRQKIEDGGIPVRKAIEYGVEMANGLAAAHERGVVHRDLKPENVFITRDGHVKLLDFGLAKWDEKRDDRNTEAPTQARMTNPGTVMGTVGYMSPEQVLGQEVDHRTDVFSLGAVLYELLTGQRAFQRGSGPETMTAILKEDPPELAEKGNRVSPALERVTRRCLEKNREERFQSARDVAYALEALSVSSSGIRDGALPAASRLRLSGWAFAALFLLTSIVATSLFVARLHRPPVVPTFQPLTFRHGRVMSAAFAPDGQTIVYSAIWNGEPEELFTTRVGDSESRALGVRSAQVQSISPSGEMALVITNSNGAFRGVRVSAAVLARMPLGGGVPRPLLENVSSADWGPDGRDLAAVVLRDGRESIEYPVGHPLLTNTHAATPRVSPRNDRIAYQDWDPSTDSGGAISTVDLQGKKEVLSPGWNHIQGLNWTPDGKEVWFTAAKTGSARALWAVDLKKHLRLLARVPGALTIMDISKDGRVLLVYLRRRGSMTAFLPGATAEREIGWLDFSTAAGISDDGRRILFTEQAEGGGANHAVYLRDMSQPEPVRLAEGTAIALSADGQWALTVHPSAPRQFVLVPTGAGLPRKLPLPFTPLSATFLPDGKGALVSGVEGSEPQRVFHLDLTTGATRPITPPLNWLCATSPDGSRFVVKDGTGHAWIYSLRGDPPRPVPGIAVSTDRDYPLQWSADGRSLFVGASPDNQRDNTIDLVDIASGARRTWKHIAADDPASFYSFNDTIVTRDGSAYVYSCRRFLTDLYLVDGLLKH